MVKKRDLNYEAKVRNLAPYKYAPGQSGNKVGYPSSIFEVVRLARANAASAMTRLAELIDSEDERIAMAASIAVLDRAYGKPEKNISDPLQTLGKEELEARATEILRRKVTVDAGPVVESSDALRDSDVRPEEAQEFCNVDMDEEPVE
jgi:hypothetical protein